MSPEDPEAIHLKNNLDIYPLVQLDNKPTSITESEESLLDWITTDNVNNMLKHYAYEPIGRSDHCLTIIHIIKPRRSK